MVKWESVVTGKKNGGLGIKNLIFQSEALRMKWLWRYSFEDQLMWKRVVGAKYEAEDSWMTKDVTSPYGAEEDALWWKGSSKGIFKVGAAYRLMEQPSQQIPIWPWRQIWKGRIPYKVSCFIWLLAKEAALTQDNVMKRGITLCSRCFVCGETSETVSHLFLHCKFTQQLWRVFLSLKGISWAMPRRITEALKSWEEAGVLAKDRTRWRIIPASI
ncbi:hypothetical protein MTR67_033692 [Solanum verrucosum]|uniref:Reverse transcriptase zinc-binding domain-containing protein n=1 Tax=Solanum verrucosum TaxID=315347 RepID=A0AAF0ZIG7_SOLVR|nr:hypothetical protein MTR67_033692 [Solanum verrucosum]